MFLGKLENARWAVPLFLTLFPPRSRATSAPVRERRQPWRRPQTFAGAGAYFHLV
jgi:hypothetical protein